MDLKTSLLLIISAMGAINCSDAKAVDGGCIDIVCSLYKSYSWQAVMFSHPRNSSIKFKPVHQEPLVVLNKYFDDTLSSLLVEDNECSKRKHEICAIDFDPIFDSQDSAAKDLEIFQVDENTVNVTFVNPSNDQKFIIVYKLVGTKSGCRISDIIYASPNASLKQILIQYKNEK